MARRQEPQLPSLMYDKAFEADGVMRLEAADSHQGQGREQSRNRPDRFVHSSRRHQKDRLAREASIDCHIESIAARRPLQRHTGCVGRAADADEFNQLRETDGPPCWRKREHCRKRTPAYG